MIYRFFLIALYCFCAVSFASSNPILPNDADSTLMTIYNKYKAVKKGQNASYIPELAKTDSRLFAISIATVDGHVISIGDDRIPFSLQSISKIFAYALAIEDNDPQTIFKEIGLDATGEKFNSIAAVENKIGQANPYVNAGAIQTTSYIKGHDSHEKWNRMLTLFKALSDGKPYLSEPIYLSETQTNMRNHAIAHLLKSHSKLVGEPEDALDRYTKACSVMVTSKQLALMGATLANNGVNPITKQKVISSAVIKSVLAQMVINGLYEKSGTWFVKAGVPTKSGVSGGLLAIIPNKMAIAVYSPPLDGSGNSVKGQMVLRDLSAQWRLHLLENRTSQS